MSEDAQPARVVLCYAQEDRDLCIQLERHLSLLVRRGLITTWHEGQLLPGEYRDSIVDAELQRANIILLLISASFLQCDDCYNVVVPQALVRHARGEALVIPILLRPVAWEDAPFSELVSLPSNGLAVTLWRDMDEAFRDIVLGIRSGLAAHALRRPFSLPQTHPENRLTSDPRRVDAAVPAHVIVREPCEVLAMVATSSSDGLRALLRVDPLSFSATLDDVRSSQFELAFPVDARGRRMAATVTIALESRDFEPPITFKKVLVPPASDSTVCTIFVTPMRAGTLPLQLEIRLGDVTVWSLRLRTNAATAGAPRAPGYIVASVPLSTLSLDPADTTMATVTGIEKLLVQSPGFSSGPQGTIVAQKGATDRHAGTVTIPKKGDRIGGDDGARFEILERLGAGGMAVVLLAKDTWVDRTVAIKFITHEVFGAGGEGVVEQFKLAARASARVSHENIVRIFDLGTANGVPFLVMEHIEGRPLDSIEATDKPDALRAVRIMTDVTRGLSHAHNAGMVHRDLKPSNVFIIKAGRAKIVDFGLASMAFGVDQRGAEWHALAGTPRYMSPEQWKGEQQDARTDIWAAGVMLFELLVGFPPFQGDSIFEVRNRVLSPDPAPLVSQFRPDLPEQAVRVVERALTKEVMKRMATADELLDALAEAEVALTGTMPPSRDRMGGRTEL